MKIITAYRAAEYETKKIKRNGSFKQEVYLVCHQYGTNSYEQTTEDEEIKNLFQHLESFQKNFIRFLVFTAVPCLIPDNDTKRKLSVLIFKVGKNITVPEFTIRKNS